MSIASRLPVSESARLFPRRSASSAPKKVSSSPICRLIWVGRFVAKLNEAAEQLTRAHIWRLILSQVFVRFLRGKIIGSAKSDLDPALATQPASASGQQRAWQRGRPSPQDQPPKPKLSGSAS
jgi:hypothetical protein